MVRRAALALLLACLSACALGGATPPVPPPFRFASDTFAFSNDTVWEYRLAPGATRMEWWKREPRPPFSLRCGPVVRAARQFLLHARFDPAAAPLAPDGYGPLVTRVLRADARRKTAAPHTIVIPGYADLRSFSAAHEPLLKATLMSESWSAFLQRGNWRMIFPFSARHQRAEAERLLAEVGRGETPIVHVVRFPDLTLNHIVLVYEAEPTPAALRFRAYDPNDATRPIELAWDRGARTFVYPRTVYFPGGPVRAYEVYDGLLY